MPRPPATHETSTAMLSIRVEPSLVAMLQALSVKRNTSQAELVKTAIKAQYAEELEGAGK